MKRIRNWIILLLCLVVWIFILVLVVNNDKLKSQKIVTQYVLIDKFNYWRYVDSKWQKLDSVNDSDDVSREISWKKYDIYVNNKYFNTLDYVFKNGEEYYFDDETKSYEVTQEKILFNDDTYLSLKDFNMVDLSDEDIDIVDKFLSKYNYSINSLTVQNKYVIDENNSIYVMSNYPSYYPKNSSGLFYMAFYRRNNKNYLLFNIGYVKNVSSYKLSWVIDAKNKFDNFVLSYTCEQITCYDMYEYQKGKFNKVVGTL